jgi:hypothetical protein
MSGGWLAGSGKSFHLSQAHIIAGFPGVVRCDVLGWLSWCRKVFGDRWENTVMGSCFPISRCAIIDTYHRHENVSDGWMWLAGDPAGCLALSPGAPLCRWWMVGDFLSGRWMAGVGREGKNSSLLFFIPSS